MSKTPRLESLEVRTLLAGAEEVDDDVCAKCFEDLYSEAEEGKTKIQLSEQAQKNIFDIAVFSGLIAGTAIFVAVGIYFGERV